MAERALIPVVAGVALGLMAGLAASVLQLPTSAVVELALVVALAAGFAGVASVVGARGDDADLRAVGLLRGGLAAGLAMLVVFALSRLLGEGDVLVGLLLLLLAVLVALPLLRLRVREAPGRRG